MADGAICKNRERADWLDQAFSNSQDDGEVNIQLEAAAGLDPNSSSHPRWGNLTHFLLGCGEH
jgi:hypothetical protein